MRNVDGQIKEGKSKLIFKSDYLKEYSKNDNYNGMGEKV